LDQVEKLNSLVTDLLDISKIENGKLKINKKQADLEEVVSNTIDTIIQTAGNPNVRIDRNFTNINQHVSFDPVRIEQVLINFLTNAIKYSPENNHVIVSTAIKKNEVRVSVTDFGIGIPEFKLASVFQKFYRVEESSVQFQGMGIGLYICSEIINQHRGTIGVSSQLG